MSFEQDAAEIDRLASAISYEALLAFRQALAEANKAERLALIERYGPALRLLHKVARKPRRRRGNPGKIETK